MTLFSVPLAPAVRAALIGTAYRDAGQGASASREYRDAREGGERHPGEHAASVATLRELLQLRSIALAGQAVAIAVAYVSDVVLHYGAMVLLLAGFAAMNFIVARHLRRAVSATHLEVATHLIADVAAFTAMLLLAGGTSNPFALLYLLHVALIGLLLPRRLALIGIATVLAGGALAVQYAVPLRLAGGRDIGTGLLMASKMLSFALTAVMIAWFVNRLSTALRLQQMLLEDAARRAYNDQALMRLGTLATGAAHELGGPLMSMSVLVHEWQRNGRIDDFQRDVSTLSGQIAACKDALAHFRAAARGAHLPDALVQSCDAFVRDVVQRFRSMRPDIPARVELDDLKAAPMIECDPALVQALLILLNNAADACAREIGLAARWTSDELDLRVIDDGYGIPAGRIGDLGHAFFTTKGTGKGNGLGVMLAAATAARLGGTISWSNREQGGAIARMRLPLSALQRSHQRGPT